MIRAVRMDCILGPSNRVGNDFRTAGWASCILDTSDTDEASDHPTNQRLSYPGLYNVKAVLGEIIYKLPKYGTKMKLNIAWLDYLVYMSIVGNYRAGNCEVMNSMLLIRLMLMAIRQNNPKIEKIELIDANCSMHFFIRLTLRDADGAQQAFPIDAYENVIAQFHELESRYAHLYGQYQGVYKPTSLSLTLAQSEEFLNCVAYFNHSAIPCFKAKLHETYPDIPIELQAIELPRIE